MPGKPFWVAPCPSRTWCVSDDEWENQYDAQCCEVAGCCDLGPQGNEYEFSFPSGETCQKFASLFDSQPPQRRLDALQKVANNFLNYTAQRYFMDVPVLRNSTARQVGQTNRVKVTPQKLKGLATTFAGNVSQAVRKYLTEKVFMGVCTPTMDPFFAEQAEAVCGLLWEPGEWFSFAEQTLLPALVDDIPGTYAPFFKGLYCVDGVFSGSLEQCGEILDEAASWGEGEAFEWGEVAFEEGELAEVLVEVLEGLCLIFCL